MDIFIVDLDFQASNPDTNCPWSITPVIALKSSNNATMIQM